MNGWMLVIQPVISTQQLTIVGTGYCDAGGFYGSHVDFMDPLCGVFEHPCIRTSVLWTLYSFKRTWHIRILIK